MNINGIPTRTLYADPEQQSIEIIDQTCLPHAFRKIRITTLEEAAHAISSMQVRGAPLIGVTAAYGIAIALKTNTSDQAIAKAVSLLRATRPTAVNLHWALNRMEKALLAHSQTERLSLAWSEASIIAEEDVAQNKAIGEHGSQLLQQIERRDPNTLNIMTHCNAGWLATIDYGTAISPIYALHDAGLPVHVWVSETRPRNQGLLTAWELEQHGVPHTVIADNAAGILIREKKIDAVIVGADRIAANADVANKVGTYLKALACADNNVPFYVAAPRSTFDFSCANGEAIPIEERSGEELRLVYGLDTLSKIPSHLRQLPEHQAVGNPAFDITPARLINALITEQGVCQASPESLLAHYPEAQT